jgi:hypothetical protein
MYFDGDIDESHQETFKVQVLLKMGILLKGLHEELLGHRSILLCPSLELQCFNDVELPAEKHESIDG